MKIRITIILLFGLTLFHQNKISAQAPLPTDSLALLCIYLDFDGPGWGISTNWTTSAPVSTWHGVTLESGRVTRIELPANNLRGTASADFQNLSQLEYVDFSDNEIDGIDIPMFAFFAMDTFDISGNNLKEFPPFDSGVFAEVDMRNNQLDFADMEDLEFSSASNFQFGPQDTLLVPDFLYPDPGTSLSLVSDIGGSANSQIWFRNGNPVATTPTYFIPSVSDIHEGRYDLRVTSPFFPGIELHRAPITVNQMETDSLGGRYLPNQIIIEFSDDATQFEKDTLLDWYEATRLDICMCGVIELWELPDTSYLGDGNIVIGVEETKNDARQKPSVEETGNNYVIDLLTMENSYALKNKPVAEPFTAPEPFFKSGSGGDASVVALIDGGADYSHPELLGYFWPNIDEVPGDNLDNDNNCLIDDARGYDFANRENDAFDDTNSGHGTHIAGILKTDISNDKLKILNLKSHDEEGFGTLFNGVCGIYYARDKQVDVINLSWGYRGVSSLVLENSIRRAGENCNALVVTSSGNEGLNNDLFPHYPSSYELDNIISVGALNLMQDDIAPFSNYGIESVDILAPGTRIFSTVPGGTSAFKDGTSMAAGFVSNLAARIIAVHPDLSLLDVKRSILESAEFMPPVDSILTLGKIDIPEAFLYADTTTIMDNSCLLTSVNPQLAPQEPQVTVYPQPFSNKVIFEFELSKASEIQLRIFDAFGRMVDLVNTELPSGEQFLNWSNGQFLSPGIYFYVLEGSGFYASGKMIKQ